MTFRRSRKLASKLKVDALPLDSNPSAEWSSKLFVADRTRCISPTNTRSLQSMAMVGSTAEAPRRGFLPQS
jgi:hypothetical protein